MGILLGSFVSMAIGGVSLWFRGRWHLSKNKKPKPVRSMSRSSK
jgi:hypothetical protein